MASKSNPSILKQDLKPTKNQLSLFLPKKSKTSQRKAENNKQVTPRRVESSSTPPSTKKSTRTPTSTKSTSTTNHVNQPILQPSQVVIPSPRISDLIASSSSVAKQPRHTTSASNLRKNNEKSKLLDVMKENVSSSDEERDVKGKGPMKDKRNFRGTKRKHEDYESSQSSDDHKEEEDLPTQKLVKIINTMIDSNNSGNIISKINITNNNKKINCSPSSNSTPKNEINNSTNKINNSPSTINVTTSSKTINSTPKNNSPNMDNTSKASTTPKNNNNASNASTPKNNSPNNKNTSMDNNSSSTTNLPNFPVDKEFSIYMVTHNSSTNSWARIPSRCVHINGNTKEIICCLDSSKNNQLITFYLNNVTSHDTITLFEIDGVQMEDSMSVIVERETAKYTNGIVKDGNIVPLCLKALEANDESEDNQERKIVASVFKCTIEDTQQFNTKIVKKFVELSSKSKGGNNLSVGVCDSMVSKVDNNLKNYTISKGELLCMFEFSLLNEKQYIPATCRSHHTKQTKESEDLVPSQEEEEEEVVISRVIESNPKSRQDALVRFAKNLDVNKIVNMHPQSKEWFNILKSFGLNITDVERAKTNKFTGSSFVNEVPHWESYNFSEQALIILKIALYSMLNK